MKNPPVNGAMSRNPVDYESEAVRRNDYLAMISRNLNCNVTTNNAFVYCSPVPCSDQLRHAGNLSIYPLFVRVLNNSLLRFKTIFLCHFFLQFFL